MGVLASNGTYSRIDERTSWSVDLSISMVIPLQQLIACLGNAVSHVFVIYIFDTYFEVEISVYMARSKDCDTLTL
jgi:hypothetical protein